MQDVQKVSKGLWDDFDLISGGGALYNRGVCVMQAVDYIAGTGSEFNTTDHPRCADENLTAFFIGLNDKTCNEERNKLRPFVPRLIGTVKPSQLLTAELALYDHAGEEDYAKKLWAEMDVILKNYREKYPLHTSSSVRSYFSTLNQKAIAHKMATGRTAWLQYLVLEQGVKNSKEVKIDEILEVLNKVLPPAKEYSLVRGQKINVIERIHKMVGYIRKRKGIKTEWPHEHGLQAPVELN